MLTKKAFTLEELILYLEAMEMLDMVYKVEKYIVYYDSEANVTYHNIWMITYEQGKLPDMGPSAIEFED